MTSHDETFPTTPMSRTVSGSNYHAKCAGCEHKDQRIAELEEAVRQERTAFNELHGISEARIADLQAKLEAAERERDATAKDLDVQIARAEKARADSLSLAEAQARIVELEHDVALWQHAAGA